MSPEERDIILEQSLGSENNLRVALYVGMAFDDLRCRIISRFADDLCSRLQKRFGGLESWRITNEIGVDGYLQKSGSLWAIHRRGGGRVCVKLTYDKSPERMYYAIPNEEAPHPPKINWALLKGALDARFAAGQSTDTWHWTSLVDWAYRNWFDMEVLLKLWKCEDAANYFTNRLSAIMGIVASVVQGK